MRAVILLACIAGIPTHLWAGQRQAPESFMNHEQLQFWRLYQSQPRTMDMLFTDTKGNDRLGKRREIVCLASVAALLSMQPPA